MTAPAAYLTECPGICLCRPTSRPLGNIERHSWRAEPTIYADEALARVVTALDQLLGGGASRARGSARDQIDEALTRYTRERRAAGVSPECILVEFKKLLRPVVGLDLMHPSSTRAGCERAEFARRLIRRLIELCFEG